MRGKNGNRNYRRGLFVKSSIKYYSTKSKYTTISAFSKKDALEKLKGNVDLFIIDIGLPDGDGISLYKEFQRNKNIPAIFLTAKDGRK